MRGKVHGAASAGFGRAAELYERIRPDYPSEAVDRLAQELEITRDGTVLDLGAGTGKLTRMLVPTGARLVAAEPVASMRERFAAVLPEVSVVGATAEDLPFSDQRFDGVVCAQAFHWFDGPRALEQVHRVLKPRGRFGLLWNIRDESVDWVAELTEIIDPYERSAPREKTGQWRQAFSATDRFGRLNQLAFPHEQRLDADGLVERFASVSFLAVLPDRERGEVLGRIRELALTHPDLAGLEEFSLPYVTELYWCGKA